MDGFHSMSSEPRVHAQEWARGPNLRHHYNCGIVLCSCLSSQYLDNLYLESRMYNTWTRDTFTRWQQSQGYLSRGGARGQNLVHQYICKFFLEFISGQLLIRKPSNLDRWQF